MRDKAMCLPGADDSGRSPRQERPVRAVPAVRGYRKATRMGGGRLAWRVGSSMGDFLQSAFSANPSTIHAKTHRATPKSAIWANSPNPGSVTLRNQAAPYHRNIAVTARRNI